MDKPHVPGNTVAVIIAGGSGTRFWPLSTPDRPKQFLRLFGERSMLQMTYDRVRELIPPERAFVLTAERHRELVYEHLPELPVANVIGEPVPRDTAGAVALAAALCRKRFGDPVTIVLPADHLIAPRDRFQELIASAVRGAADGCLYTFGVVPDFPATGYGYLEQGDAIKRDGTIEHYALKRFKEKPDAQTAERFLQAGTFFWNSGMFVWRSSAIWKEIQTHLPEHAAALEKACHFDGTSQWYEMLEAALMPLPKVSIDVAVMEQAADVRMVKSDVQWSDVGGWLAVEKFFDPVHPNLRGRGRLHAHEANNCFALCEDEEEMVAFVGVHDLVVVRSGHRTLVAHKSYVEKMKGFVEQLNAEEHARS